MPDRHLLRIELPDAPPPPSAYAEADRRQAVQDLEGGNRFDPAGLGPGPFVLHLMVREGRLILDIRDRDGAPLRAIILVLGPFRRLIKDYHMLVDSHEEAVTAGAMDARVQAIDMGRRGSAQRGGGAAGGPAGGARGARISRRRGGCSP
jgi:uncharacterized protein (UPF0262 family)